MSDPTMERIAKLNSEMDEIREERGKIANTLKGLYLNHRQLKDENYRLKGIWEEGELVRGREWYRSVGPL